MIGQVDLRLGNCPRHFHIIIDFDQRHPGSRRFHRHVQGSSPKLRSVFSLHLGQFLPNHARERREEQYERRHLRRLVPPPRSSRIIREPMLCPQHTLQGIHPIEFRRNNLGNGSRPPEQGFVELQRPHLIHIGRLPLRQRRQTLRRRLHGIRAFQILMRTRTVQKGRFHLLELQLTPILLGVDALIEESHVRGIPGIVHPLGDEIVELLRTDQFLQKRLKIRRLRQNEILGAEPHLGHPVGAPPRRPRVGRRVDREEFSIILQHGHVESQKGLLDGIPSGLLSVVGVYAGVVVEFEGHGIRCVGQVEGIVAGVHFLVPHGAGFAQEVG
mmetsp:Transcript_14041/g.26900  ORF Transcript_14041/g.26900 Transcript_14041/m.26900 type:complete len:328 (-) Transcript_14041:244-1227(-)